MRKEDLTVPAILAEAVGLIIGMVYIGLQIFYGVAYHAEPMKLILNLAVAVLVYAGLTLLSSYPEKINGIAPELCKGKIRKYSIRMVRVIKIIFIASLLIPCVADAAGFQVQSAYSLLVIGMLIIVAVYYEYQIIHGLRNMK